MLFYIDDPKAKSVNYMKRTNDSKDLVIPAGSFIRYMTINNNIDTPLKGEANISIRLEDSEYIFDPNAELTSGGLNERGMMIGPFKNEITSDKKLVMEVSADVVGRIYGKVIYEGF